MGKVDLNELWPAVAIGAGLFLAGRVAFGDGMTDEQRAARAQTNTGAPTDRPGQVLVGEPDYIKVYKGQKVDALQRFGENLEADYNNLAFPVTTRQYAHDTVLGYWMREIERLCGLTGETAILSGADSPLAKLSLNQDHRPVIAFGYRGLVNLDSANAIVRGWNNLREKLRGALFGSFDLRTDLQGFLGQALSPVNTVQFWETIRELAILVDVDRAVPDSAGILWASIYEAAKEAPGVLVDAVAKVADEASQALLIVVWAALKNVVLSPVGLAAMGVGAWLYRAELGELYRRAFP